MNRPRPRLAPLAAFAAVAALAALAGCGKGKYVGLLPANQRPEVELTQVPATTTSPYFYAYEIRWAGFDADGGIDHYVYCIDPPTVAAADTPWVSTTANRQTFLFRSDSIDTPGSLTGRGFHTFVIKAVDNGGLASAPAHRSFNSYTIAPSVQILAPLRGKDLVTPKFGPSLRMEWKGSDPDGRTSHVPVKYKYKIFTPEGTEFDYWTVLLNPDSMRVHYGPRFSTWDSVGGDTTHLDLHDLTPGVKLLVFVAFDEAGAYSPVFKLDESMTVFQVTYNRLGPALTLFNESFYYQFPGPGFFVDPKDYIRVELPADQPINFHWSGKSDNGAFVTGYRWRLDGDIGDETQRTNESTDIGRWSRWSALNTTCTLPPISPPPGLFDESHFFYLEGKDNTGYISLAVVSFTVVRPRFDRELLIVDDTRLKLDTRLADGSLARPSGAWPTAAELDTFFYAAGGNVWRGYPAGTVSPVGAFQGYSFDTVATRFMLNGAVPLGLLGHYRQAIWYTDFKSATNTNPPDYVRDPMPYLRAASAPGQSNPLATWIKQGGKAWVFGGGAAYCTQREWEKTGTSAMVFSNADTELVAGRFMFDLTHWRSEITDGTASQARWSTAGSRAWPGSPDYSRLPAILREKTAATDPIAVYGPNRQNQGEYYQVVYTAEALTKANTIVQDMNPDVNLVDFQPVLDTLYTTTGGSLGTNKPIMTLYHGDEHQKFIFSGFPIWYFQRAQTISMIDFVLQDTWGMTRRPVDRGTPAP